MAVVASGTTNKPRRQVLLLRMLGDCVTQPEMCGNGRVRLGEVVTLGRKSNVPRMRAPTGSSAVGPGSPPRSLFAPRTATSGGSPATATTSSASASRGLILGPFTLLCASKSLRWWLLPKVAVLKWGERRSTMKSRFTT